MSSNRPSDEGGGPLGSAPRWALLALIAVGAAYVWLGEALWPAEHEALPAQWAAFEAFPLQERIGLASTLVICAALFVALPIALGALARNVVQGQQLVASLTRVIKKQVTPRLDEILQIANEILESVKAWGDRKSETSPTGQSVDAGTTSDSPSAPEESAPSEPLGAPNDSYQITVAPNFVRQEEHLDAIKAALATDSGLGGVWIQGRPRVGKTSIMGVVAREFGTKRFRDGIVYINCAPPKYADAADALRKVIQRFDPPRRVPGAERENLIDAVRASLRGKSALIVLDNVPLSESPSSAGSTPNYEEVVEALATVNTHVNDDGKTDVRLVMITEPVGSAAHRFKPVQTATLRVVQIGFLTPELAQRLFLLRYGLSEDALTDDDRRAVASIVASLDNFPLAVARLGVRVREDNRRLQDVADELASNPLEAVRDDTVVRVYADSFTSLRERDPHAAELLMAWCAFGANVNTVGRQALAALTQGIELQNAEIYLSKLERLGFVKREVTEALSSKYDTHDWKADTERWHADLFMLAYLKQHFEALADEKRSSAYLAVANHFARYAAGAPLSALAIEEDAIVHALDWSLASPSAEGQACAVSMAIRIGQFWRSRWDNERGLKHLPSATKLAERIARRSGTAENQRRKADLYFLLGRAYRHVGALPDAEVYYLRANVVFRRRKTRDFEAEATTYNHLAKLSRLQGRLDDAERLSKQALKVVNTHPNPKQEGLALSELGRIARIRGQIPAAVGYFTRALHLLEDAHETLDVGVQQGYLGRLARMQGHLDDARDWFAKSDKSAELAHDTRGRGVVLSYRARIERTAGNIKQATKLFNDSLKIAEGVSDAGTQSSANGYLGRMEYTVGNIDEANKRFQTSYDIAHKTRDGQNEAMAMGYLGRIQRAQGNQIEGLRWRIRSYIKVRLVGDRRGQALSTRHLGRLMLQLRLTGVASMLARRAQSQLHEAGDVRGVATAKLLRGEIAAYRGNLVAAHRLFTECRQSFTALEDGGNVCACDYWLARVADANGETARANGRYEKALTRARDIGDCWNEGRVLYYQGLMLSRAKETHDDGLRLIGDANNVYQRMRASAPKNRVRRRSGRAPLPHDPE